MTVDVWLIGYKGMLGHEVAGRLKRSALSFHATDMDCDITDPADLRETAHAVTPRWIVNCSAYTAVDKAEEEEELAYRINAEGVRNIGRAATDVGASVIHVSTDYVFDGSASEPYQPYHPTNPLGAYGRTKLAGEQLLAEATPSHIIVRTAWLYGLHGKNFVSTMLRLMNERDEIKVVADQHGSPTYAPDLADAIVRFVEAQSDAYGIYHFTNSGETTWHGFASAIYDRARTADLVCKACEVMPISTSEYPTPAKRPAYSVLDTEKLRSELGISIPSWQDGLQRYLNEIATESKESRA